MTDFGKLILSKSDGLSQEFILIRNQHAIGNCIVDFSPKGDDVRAAQKTDH